MDAQNDKQPVPTRALTPDEMEARIERLKAEGRMPSLEQFLEAMAAGREEYVRSLEAESAIPPNVEPRGPADVCESVVSHRATAKRTIPVSIDDFKRVRAERRDGIGLGTGHAGMPRKTVTPVPTVEANAPGPEETAEWDLTVGREGNIITIAAHTETGARFLYEDLQPEPWQWIGEVLCVDHGLGKAVQDDAENKGLSVRLLE